MNLHDYFNQSMPNFVHAWWWTVYPGETPWDWLTRHGIGFWGFCALVVLVLGIVTNIISPVLHAIDVASRPRTAEESKEE